MEWFALFIPALFAIGFTALCWKKVKPWVVLVFLLPTALMIGLLRLIMISSATSDTEFLGSYTYKVQYDEPWNEYIHATCPETHCSGTGKNRSCHTTYKDCSYVRYHSAEWRKIDNFNNSYSISKEEYRQLLKQFKANENFIDMHRDYHTEDGDRYEAVWGGEFATVDPISKTHEYTNNIKLSHSLFKLRNVDDKQKVKYKLYDYPQVIDNYQLSVLSRKPVNETHQRYFMISNALLGYVKQVRVFVVIFEDLPREAGFMQEQYWEGGNKNELIIAIGTDSKTNKIKWVYPFSWMDSPIVEVKVRNQITKLDTLDLGKIHNIVFPAVKKDWKRKQFHDFDYIKLELTSTQLVWLYIIIFIINIGLSVAIYKYINENYY